MIEIELSWDGYYGWQWKIITDLEIAKDFYLEGSGFDSAEDALADAMAERDYINEKYWSQRQLALF